MSPYNMYDFFNLYAFILFYVCDFTLEIPSKSVSNLQHNTCTVHNKVFGPTKYLAEREGGGYNKGCGFLVFSTTKFMDFSSLLQQSSLGFYKDFSSLLQQSSLAFTPKELHVNVPATEGRVSRFSYRSVEKNHEFS